MKVGHAGTLDPFATGLLLVLVGRATRVQRFLMALPKRYETVARLGFTSTTGDPEGEIAPGRHARRAARAADRRCITQRPPAYTAIKIGGKRAYALARAGEEVEIPEREVEVTPLRAALARGRTRAAFAIECSSGTYVRSLITDLDDAYCVELRRTQIGDFDVADADEERLIGARRRAVVPAGGRPRAATRRAQGRPRRGRPGPRQGHRAGCATRTA